MQVNFIRDTLYEMSNPVMETICMKCQTVFSKKKKSVRCLLKILSRLLNSNTNLWLSTFF